MPPIIHRLSYGLIIFALIALVSGPAFGSVVYFGNISDWPQTFPVGTMGRTSLKAGCLEAAAEPYRDYMTMSAQIVGLDAALIVAVTKQESQFNPTIVSPARAVGMMQMLPETFASLSKTYGKDYTGAYAAQKSAAGLPAPLPSKVITNPEYNIFLGSHYLRQAYDRYNHRLDLTLASYNAGPDNEHIKIKHVVPPYKETQDYVRIITASYNDYKSRCQENLTPASPTGSTSNTAAATTLKQYVANHPKDSCQKSNDSGNNCAITDRNVLAAAFPNGHPSASNEWIPTQSSVGSVPGTGDLTQAQQILSDGNLPVWHVRGDVSGQHWIVITGIQGTNVEFFDPATGTTDTRSIDTKSKSPSYPNDYYFGLSDLEGKDNSQNKRGYTFFTGVKP